MWKMTRITPIKYRSAPNDNIVFIMRGLPGNGKSSVATIIEQRYLEMGFAVSYCSADEHMTQYDRSSNTWNYHFSLEDRDVGHAKCRDKFKIAIQNRIRIIIVDNTGVTNKEVNWYKNKAIKAEYWPCVITVGDAGKESVNSSKKYNTHGCPDDIIENMAQKFEFKTGGK